MHCLPKLSDEHINQLNCMISKYLWNDHKPKIALDVLQSEKSDNGAGLCDFWRKDISLKAAWVKLLMNHNYLEKMVYQIIQPELGPNVWICELRNDDVRLVMKTQNNFWMDVL